MREALDTLGAVLCRGTFPAAEPGLDAGAAAEAVVALPAGGFGYRMRGVGPESGGVTQKSLLPLPNGETLIGRTIRQYTSAGVRRFVALVNHAGAAVEEHLAGGRPWGVEVRASYDPHPEGSGRTGALLHAVKAGILPPDRTVVVHNADCQVMRYAGSFPADLLHAHARAVRERGAVATVAAVDGTPYPYTGMSVAGGMVEDVEMYPFIPVPTHAGITVLSPEALASLEEHFQQTKQNFERDMFPRWAAQGRLAALLISHRSWIAVDDRKAYRQFSEAVRGEPPQSRAA
jgi:NDP-sugar pyrophosphorylase family protein